MRLALAAGGALLLALLTWLLLSGINTNASAYAETQRAFDDFALAEASIGRDVLQARAGLLGNYDVLAEAEEAMESAASRIRLHVEAENLDPKPVEALAAAVGQYEDLIERFKTGNSLLQNSLSYVGQLSTDPAFGALGDQFAPSATALAAAVLRLAGDSSPESAKSLQQHINRFEAQAPTGGLEGEAAHALLAHARLLSDLLPEVDQTLRALVAAPSRQPFEETRELLARAQATFEVTAQRFRVLLYAVSLGLLVIALRLGQRLWTRTLRIRRLVDANIIGIFIWEFDGRIIEANDAFLRMVGYDHEDIVSGRMRWTELTPPEWLDRDERGWLPELKVTGSLQPFEKEYFRKDGSRVPVLIGAATFEEDGNQGVSFVLDLTERKRAEKALRQSEANLAEAQRLSHTGSWVLNPATSKVLYWSEECYRIWGFDPVQGPPYRAIVLQRIHPDDRDRVYNEAQEALRQKRDHTIEFRIVLPDGTVKYLEAIGHHVFSEQGELVEVVGTNVDVTERKRADQALRDSEAKIRRLVDANIIGIFIWDFDGRILEANEAFLDIVGYDHEDLVAGRIRWTDLTPPEWRDRDTRLIQEHKVTGTLPPFEKEYFRKDGSRVPVLIGVATFEEGGNQGVAFVLDLTERKRVEERLRVEHTVAQILAEAVTIEEATLRILRAMGECLGWDVGALWRVDRKAEALRCVELWHKASIEVPEFERVSRGSTFVPGLGLPGRVWSSLEPEYVPDVVPDENFPRGPIAEQEGLHAALAFPILLGGEALGVIEFFSREIRQPDQELLNVLATIGSQIGQFIERKRGEVALRESEAKFRDFAETASDWFCEMGPDYKFTLLSENAFGSGAADRIGTACWDHALDLETEPEKWRLLQETVFSRKPFRDFVYRGMSSDGSAMYVRASGKPLFDANGEFLGYRGTCSDVTEIMRAHEALRESERSLRSAIDGIAGLVAVMAPNGELDAINLQVIEYFGRSLEEMKNWGTSDAVHPEDLPRIAEILKRSLATGTPFNYELRLRRFDGEYRWFDNRGVPTREKSGRIVRWYILGTDIEDRKRAEEALRESETKFRDYAETASDWFWEIGPDYKYTLLTENAFGSLAADRLGTSAWDHALDLETEPEKWRLFQATLDARKPFRDLVFYTVGGNGSPTHVKASGKPVFDANGEFRGYRGTGTDVTAIMRVQEALRESERSARSAIDGIAGLLAVMAPNGELETVNRPLFDYFGRPLEWLKNWGTNDAVHPEDLPRVLELFQKGMASGSPFNFELRMRRFDGEYRWFDNRGVPIRDDSGRIARWYVLLTDIEDRTRALARLEQMQSDFAHMNRVSMLGELAGSLSHEITQPIAAARNYTLAALNFLGQQAPDLGEVKKALGSVLGAADRSGEIIERIRDHIKKAPPRKAHFDLNHAIDEVLVLARSAITRNGVSVQTLLAEGLAAVQGDRVQLQQVVLNLILNAVEAMGSVEAGPRELLISTEQNQAKGALVAVRDSGPGLDPENLERVFEAFYTTKTSGMGMGLSICRSIIDAHGGRLWAGVNEPRGAVFQFTLPDAEKEIMGPRPAALHTRARYEDSASDAVHPLAYEDNK